MKATKIAAFLLAAILSVTTLSVLAKADTYTKAAVNYREKIKDKKVDPKFQDIGMKGVTPSVHDLDNTAFQSVLDERFKQQYNAFLKKTNINTKSIEFGYSIFESGRYTSVRFYCTLNLAASSENYVSTTVIDVYNDKIVLLNDVLGPNGVKLINKDLAEQIAAEPKKYNASFTGIKETHSFYIDGDTVCVTFDEFELMIGLTGIFEYKLRADAIANVIVLKDDCIDKPGLGIKMIKLRTVTDEFGYSLLWNESENAVDILKDKKTVTSMTIDVNSYALAPNGAGRGLEAAPMLLDGWTYAPISFFEEILSIAYSVDAEGTVTFSIYKK